MFLKTSVFSLVVLSLVLQGQGQTRARVSTSGTGFAGSVLSISADGESSNVSVRASLDSETSVEVDFEDDDDDDDDENTVTVTTPVGNGKKSGSKKRPSRKMSPGKNGVEKVERRANRVCLVNDFSRFDELVRNGRNVVAVRRFNKNLVEITQAMTTKTSSSKATVTTTRIPRDIKKLCNITEKDLDVITDDVQVSPGVLRFTFSSDNGVPDEKETLRGVCTQVFGRSINGLMESCVDAVGSA